MESHVTRFRDFDLAEAGRYSPMNDGRIDADLVDLASNVRIIVGMHDKIIEVADAFGDEWESNNAALAQSNWEAVHDSLKIKEHLSKRWRAIVLKNAIDNSESFFKHIRGGRYHKPYARIFQKIKVVQDIMKDIPFDYRPG